MYPFIYPTISSLAAWFQLFSSCSSFSSGTSSSSCSHHIVPVSCNFKIPPSQSDHKEQLKSTRCTFIPVFLPFSISFQMKHKGMQKFPMPNRWSTRSPGREWSTHGREKKLRSDEQESWTDLMPGWEIQRSVGWLEMREPWASLQSQMWRPLSNPFLQVGSRTRDGE